VILFKRVANILKAATESLPPVVNPERFSEVQEKTLLGSLIEAHAASDPLWTRRAYAEILPSFLAMERAIHDFFDHVLVNADDLGVRANRLKLLAEVRDLFVRGWDLSRVVVEGDKG
jgi:glycyl-tRNA synthetase beta chain